MVTVWRVDLDAPADESDLGPDERTRAAAFRVARDAHRFVAGRSALRRILAQAVGTGARDVRFAYGPYGKPRLAQSASGIAFSTSRSRETGLVAVSLAGEVGVDCEYVDEAADLRPLVARYPAAPAEPRAFYRWWTALEARVKLRGGSLAARLDAGAFDPLPVVTFELSGGWTAALAQERDGPFQLIAFT